MSATIQALSTLSLPGALVIVACIAGLATVAGIAAKRSPGDTMIFVAIIVGICVTGGTCLGR